MTMQLWDFDVETKKLEYNEPVNRVICFSYSDGKNTGLVARDFGAYDVIKWLLTNDDILLINQNIAFDLGCVAYTWPDLAPFIIEKYDKLLIDDIMIREQLYAVARGYYKDKENIKGYFSLAGIVDRRFGVQLEKGGIQLQYELVDNLPIEKYPKEYKDYSLFDAYWPIRVYYDQNESFLRYFETDVIPDSKEQSRAHFAFFLSGKLCGIRTDPNEIVKVEKTFLEEQKAYEPALKHWGIIRSNGKKNKKRLQQIVEYAAKNQGLPEHEYYTNPSKKYENGQVSTSKETIDKLDFPILNIQKEHNRVTYYLNNYVKMLKTGIHEPIRVFYRMLDTGRESASPNIQNQSRRYGIRECYIPTNADKGWQFINCDYGAIEMCTFAQCLKWFIGNNRLMDALNNDIDPHVELCRNFPQINMSYNQAISIKNDKSHKFYDAIYGPSGARFVAKIGNFGYAGGMGASTFIDYALKNSDGLIILDEETAQMAKTIWLNTWPESKPYFKIMGQIADDSDPVIEQFISHRLRGVHTFTQIANGFFQALAADGAKNALWLITKACFYDKKSPLYGCIPNAFIHDEFLLSAPPDRAIEASEELSRLMIVGMTPYVPDIKIKTSKSVSNRWHK